MYDMNDYITHSQMKMNRKYAKYYPLLILVLMASTITLLYLYSNTSVEGRPIVSGSYVYIYTIVINIQCMFAVNFTDNVGHIQYNKV